MIVKVNKCHKLTTSVQVNNLILNYYCLYDDQYFVVMDAD